MATTTAIIMITITTTATRMFEYDFMRTAFAASGVAAVLAGFVGYFLVLRGQTFAGHALSHVGFTGATGAALFGLSPLAGLVGFTVLAGVGMGLFGEKLAERDVAIGMMLSLALGLGLLFLHFYTSAATAATALLFGNVLGVDSSALADAGAAGGFQPGLAGFHRASADLRLAAGRARRSARRADEARLGRLPRDRRDRGRRMRADRRRAARLHADGRPRRRRPERLAKARRRCRVSAGLALFEAWGGLTLAFYTDWPVSFWITALSGAVYFGSLVARRG